MYKTILLVLILFSRLKKYIYYCAGFLFLGIGIAGYVLPGLPGTIFLILAAGCFMRSNRKMYLWVTNHRVFGKLIKDFLETGAMPLKAKVISISCIWIFTALSLYAPYNWIFKVSVLSVALIGTWYILSRPTSKRPR
ncbi:MAG: hypothetical protein CL887_01390 [Dehalococcoidia bacterium]|nr:hypothetical protein [Dehalococcoidia bacterium]